jgi:Carboxypeptidase regulatory-like domain
MFARQLGWKLLFAMSLFGGIAAAQVTTGSITGTVKDSAGAVLPGVSIKLTNTETGATRTVIADEVGRYNAPQLPLGAYEISAELPGFQTAVRRGITLTIGREAVVDFALQVGSVSQEVTVNAEAALVSTTNANLSYLIDDKKIRDLPLNGRNYTQLATLQPGVIPILADLSRNDVSGGHGLKMSIGGAQSTQNSFLMDGQDVTDYSGQTPGSVAGTNLGIDAIREFTITTNNYSSEYGLVAGGVMNVVTNSGTNAFHGSGFEFLRNSALDAKNYFDPGNQKIPAFKRNQFGGVIGGPIKKDKVFFLGSYEGLRERLGLTYNTPVPNADAHQGYLPINGVRQFIGVHPGVQAMMNLYHLPNGPDNGDGTGQFINNPIQPSTENYVLGRIDDQLSEKNSLYGRYVFDQADVTRPGQLGIYGTSKYGRNQFFQLGLTRVISPRWINETRAAFNRTYGSFAAAYLEDVPVAQLSVLQGRDLASIWDITGGQAIALIPTSDGVFIETPRRFTNNIFEFADNASYLRGSHTFKFGVIFKNYLSNPRNNRNYMGTVNFSSVRDFMMGTPQSILGQIVDSQLSYQQYLFGWFVQDDIKLNPRLSLTIGLRHEFVTPESERYGRAASMKTVFDSGPTLGQPLFVPHKDNIAPRVGLAWDPFGNGKTSVRIGAGSFQEQLVPGVLRYTYASMPHITKSFTLLAPGQGVLRVDPNTVPASAGTGLNFQPNPSSPTRYQWSLDIQREVVSGTTVSVAYVGARGVHLQYNPSINEFTPTCWPNNCTDNASYFYPGGTPRINPRFTTINAHRFDGNSYYHSFQANITRRFSNGLQYQGSYTWSRNLDTAATSFASGVVSLNAGGPQNPFNMRAEKGLSPIDPRHQFSSNVTYDLPFAKNTQGIVKAIASGWQSNLIVTLRAGVPFNITSGYTGTDGLGRSRSGFTQGTNAADRPSLAPGAKIHTSGTTAGCQGVAPGTKLGTPSLWFDPCVFILPPVGTFGNLAKNAVIGPGLADVDFAMRKQFNITERTNLQFRAEAFNLFNHPNFGNMIVPVFSGSTGARNGSAGRIIDTSTTSRQIQFALRLTF